MKKKLMDGGSLTNPLKARKVVQNQLKRSKNGYALQEGLKVVYSGCPLKSYMMGDGITSLPFGHPLLKKHIYKINEKLKCKTNNDYQQDNVLLEKIKAEKNIYLENRSMYIQKQLLKTGKIEDNQHEIDFLSAVTKSLY